MFVTEDCLVVLQPLVSKLSNFSPIKYKCINTGDLMVLTNFSDDILQQTIIFLKRGQKTSAPID
jgi:hypothetical protein